MKISKEFIPPSASAYANTMPFPHAVLKDLWDDNFLGSVAEAIGTFEDWDGEKQFYGSQAKRFCATWERLPNQVVELINYANRPEFLSLLESITGESELIPDPYLNGGGIHSIGPGGFLKMHADFNWHKKMGVYRRLNLLIYLNREWNKSWGGDLRLASKSKDGLLSVEKTIFPHFNTTVIFTTDENSFHGHPDPLTNPDGVRRNSIALYYYVAKKPQGVSSIKREGTDYRDLSGNKMKQTSKLTLLLTDPKKFARLVSNRISK